MIEISNKLRIFIVSADADRVVSLKKIFSTLGLRDVQQEANGLKAMEILQENPPELLIIDEEIKLLSGLLFLREMRLSQHIRNIPALFVGSAKSQIADEDLSEFGVVKLLRAPFSGQEIMQTVADTLAKFQNSSSLEFRYKIAKDHLIENKTDQAIPAFANIHKETKGSIRSAAGLAQSYMAAGEVDKAATIVNEVHHHELLTPSLFFLKITALLTSDKKDDAAQLMKDVIKVQVELPLFHLEALRAVQEFDFPDLVEFIATDALSKKMELPEFEIALARLKASQPGESENALKLARVIEKKYGKSAEILNLQAVCLRKLQEFEKAISIYEDALRLSPMDHRIYFNLGLCEIALNRLENAKSRFQTCLSILPNYDKASTKIAEINEKLKKNQEAA